MIWKHQEWFLRYLCIVQCVKMSALWYQSAYEHAYQYWHQELSQIFCLRDKESEKIYSETEYGSHSVGLADFKWQRESHQWALLCPKFLWMQHNQGKITFWSERPSDKCDHQHLTSVKIVSSGQNLKLWMAEFFKMCFGKRRKTSLFEAASFLAGLFPSHSLNTPLPPLPTSMSTYSNRSLRYHDGDSGKNVTEKVTSRSMKL